MWFLFLSSSMIGLYSVYRFYTKYLFPPALKSFDEDSSEESDVEDEDEEDYTKLYKFICYRVVFEDNSETVLDSITEDEMKELYKFNDDPKYKKPANWVEDEMIPNPKYSEWLKIKEERK